MASCVVPPRMGFKSDLHQTACAPLFRQSSPLPAFAPQSSRHSGYSSLRQGSLVSQLAASRGYSKNLAIQLAFCRAIQHTISREPANRC